MKTSVEIRRNTGRMIAKNLIVLAVIAVVAFIGVMSWFTKNQTATANGINAQTKVSNGLEFYIMPPSANDQYDAINQRLAENDAYNEANNLSEGDAGYRRTTWHTSTDGNVSFNTDDQEFMFMKDLFLCEVTSDGATFKVPKLMQYDDVAYIDTAQNFDDAKPNDEYLSYDVYFRCKTDQNSHTVSLRRDSSISPNPDSSTYLTSEQHTIFDPAAPANSTQSVKDAAIGAVRMSVLNLEASNAREVLWIPGPYVYYNGMTNTDTLDTGLTSSQYANKGAVYYNGSGLALRTGEGTNSHAYYESKDDRVVLQPDVSGMSGKVNGTSLQSSDSRLAGSMIVGEKPESSLGLVTLNQSKNNDGYYYGHIRVNLWIEGEDAEARLAFVGGKFSFSMNYELDTD